MLFDDIHEDTGDVTMPNLHGPSQVAGRGPGGANSTKTISRDKEKTIFKSITEWGEVGVGVWVCGEQP